MTRLAYFAAGVLRLTFSCVVAQSQRLRPRPVRRQLAGSALSALAGIADGPRD